MSPAETIAAYRRAFLEDHETVVLKRVGPKNTTIATSEPILARVTGYQTQELTGGIQQGDMRVLILAEDVEASGFPLPLQQGGADRIVLRGRSMTPQSIDDNTRRVSGILIAFQIQVRGN